MAPRLSKAELARRLQAARPHVPLTCVHCGASFTSYEGTLYCSDSCRQAAYYQANRERLNKAAAERQKRKRQERRAEQHQTPTDPTST